MQLAHILEIPLPGVVSSQAEQDEAQLVKASQQGSQDAFAFLLILSGILLAAFGPQWWHLNAIGHFVNSLHFWCAEAFFFSMTLHLWTAFFKGAWRHGRGLT